MTKSGSLWLVLVLAILAACSDSMDKQSIEQKYTNEASRFVSIDGNRVHYRDEGAGEVIVLIHGTASSLHTWDQWSEALTRQYRVIRMDLPGFGLTGPDHSDRYEVDDDVHFLSEFLQTLRIEQAHLVGSSLGGRIAWQYALGFPQQVQSLTLMNALGYPQESWPPPIAMAQLPVMDTIMAHVSPRFMYEMGLKDVYHDEQMVDEALVDRYFELSRYPGNLAAFPKRVVARLDQDASLIPAIDVPTLILWGEEDQYFPVESAYRFQEDITGARLHVYPEVGHLPMEELPEASLADFVAFIQPMTL